MFSRSRTSSNIISRSILKKNKLGKNFKFLTKIVGFLITPLAKCKLLDYDKKLFLQFVEPCFVARRSLKIISGPILKKNKPWKKFESFDQNDGFTPSEICKLFNQVKMTFLQCRTKSNGSLGECVRFVCQAYRQQLRGNGGRFLWQINMIMAYFDRKGYIQRNLYSNCVSL